MPEGNISAAKNGWDEWGKHVLEELRRLAIGQDNLVTLIGKVESARQEDYKECRKEYDDLRKDFAQLCTDVAINKTKIAIISSISGFLAGGAMSLILILIERAIP